MRLTTARSALIAVLLVAFPADAAEPCALCSKQIVTNRELAGCFLEKFSELSARTGTAVAVDLSDCPSERGIVDALPTLGGGALAPDTSFLVTKRQLDCLKAKIEEPGLKLDPQARIDLGSCG